MNLSNPQRFAKLAVNLIANPRYLFRYLRCIPAWGRRSIDLGIPWWSFAAIDYMRSRLHGKENVFEYGSGGSTVFLSRLCATVHAVEDDLKWATVVRSRLQSSALVNVTISMLEYDFRNCVRFEESAYLKALNGAAYDVIVVDGQDWNFEVRPVCFYRAERHVKPGGVIIVDDSWRYTALRQRNSAKSYRVFKSVGPCRYGVTSTDVYFY